MRESAEQKTSDLISFLKQRDNVVIAGILIIFLILTRATYKQQMAKRERLTNAIQTEEEKNASMGNIVALNEKIKKYKARSWNTGDINVIIQKIYNIGLETPVKIKNISPIGKKEEKNYILIPLNVNFQGLYKDVLKFTKKIENYPMMLRVTELTISPRYRAKQGSETQLQDIAVIVEAVYLK